ncbi:MAG TPA: DUF998 domain-containing protein [Parafilimonas sp.]|nr:DUF998 domain-containing protein [Parafilimonas sp.]
MHTSITPARPKESKILAASTRHGSHKARKLLLTCGIFSSLLYIAMNIYVPTRFPGYSITAQTVSELSAIDSPTRSLWILPGILYCLLVAAFGCGIWQSANKNRSLRITGSLLFTYGIIGLFWPPMHLRDVLAAGGGTLTDTMHIVFTVITVLLMLSAIGFGAAAFENRFRLYSIVTFIILLVFGAFTSFDAPRLQANLPTPRMGVWERVNIGAFLLWVIILAIVLLKSREKRDAISDTNLH